MSFYPSNLKYFLNRLSSFSRNRYRLSTQTPTTASPQDVIVISLPENTIVDLDTLTWAFNGSTTATGGTTPSVFFPKHIETIIDSISVEINGVAVQNTILNYGQLMKVLLDYTCGDKIPQRAFLQNSTAVPAAALPTGSVYTNAPFQIKNWLGWLGSVQPRLIDTSLLGTVKIYIRLAPTSVLAVSGAPASINYSLSNMYFHVDAVDISDGIYYNMVQKMLESRPLDLPFDNFVSFSGGSQSLANAVTRFGLSTQSLDMLIGTILPNTVSGAVDTTIGSGNAFVRGDASLTSSTAQFSVNNVLYPLWECSLADQYSITLDALGLSQDTVGSFDPLFTQGPITTNTTTITNNLLTNYASKFYVFAVRFNHGEDQADRVVSGIDLRGTTAMLEMRVKGGTGNQIPQVWAKTKSTLSVGKYRQLSVQL